MTKKELASKRKELAKLEAFIAKHESKGTNAFTVTENLKNTEEYGARYVFIGIEKGDDETRKALKKIRWGAKGRGKPRFCKENVSWSCLAEGLKGTPFAV